MNILNFDDVNRSKYFKAKVRYRALYISVAKEYYVGTKMLGRAWRILN